MRMEIIRLATVVIVGKTVDFAAAAIERMHGNTHLPQLLGAMARYEATGDSARVAQRRLSGVSFAMVIST